MAQNYRRAKLRGKSFKGQDLTGADFSNSDIRGADFTGAILHSANFCNAKAGLQRRWAIALVMHYSYRQYPDYYQPLVAHY